MTKQNRGISPTHVHLRITRHTWAAFGCSVNPHGFRDALATTVAIGSPELIGIITPLPGHRAQTTAQGSPLLLRIGRISWIVSLYRLRAIRFAIFSSLRCRQLGIPVPGDACGSRGMRSKSCTYSTFVGLSTSATIFLFRLPWRSITPRWVRLQGVPVAGVLRKPVEMPEAGCSSSRAKSATTAKWLVCASGKGGTGKTTMALNLATIATAAGLEVALLDMDDQQTLSEWHSLRPEGVPSLHLLTIPLVDVERAVREVKAAVGLDLIIVDTPPGLDQRIRLRELVQHADLVLVPTTQGPGDVRSVTEFMATLKALQVKAVFLLNRTNQRWGSYREARRKLNKAGPLCPVDVRQLRDIEATNSYGVGINEFDRAKGAEDLEAVWDFAREAMGL